MALLLVLLICIPFALTTLVNDAPDFLTFEDDIVSELSDIGDTGDIEVDPVSDILQVLLEVNEDTSAHHNLVELLGDATGNEIKPNKAVLALLAEENGNNQVAENNIAFELPDLTITIETTSGLFQMEAFKSTSNDQILREQDKDQQLIWVSVGQPIFAKTKLRGEELEKLFHFSATGFYTYVQMLTLTQSKLLAATASRKYRVTVADYQIVNLILSRFECSLQLYNEAGNKYLVKGTVTDFRNFPLRLDFTAPRNSLERKLFEELLGDSEDDADLQFLCNMASKGKVMKTNTLSITTQQMEQIGLEEKLFGSSPSDQDVFVTRDQTTALASEMYSTLNIVEDYQMPELQFSEAFVEDLISQAATSHFTMTPIDTVLASLSKYGLDISGDLKPDVIKRDLGEILRIDNSESKSRIVLNEETYKKYEESRGSSGGGSVGFLGISVGANYGRNNAKVDLTEVKSLNDQLNELNTLSQNDIKWAVEGEKVVPKSLNVARISRTKMSKTLTFNRVRVQTINAPFDREFGIYTYRSGPVAPILDQLNTRVAQLTTELNQVSSTSQAATQSLTANINSVSASLNQQGTDWTGKFQQLSGTVQQLTGPVLGTQQQINTLSTTTVKRCRICFQQSNQNGRNTGECWGAQNTCSGWSDATSWTQGFTDDTDKRGSWCTLHWMVECQK